MKMQLGIKHITIDCIQPRYLATWWASFLGWTVQHDNGDYVVVSDVSNGQYSLGFIRVPDVKSGKNRLHLDISVDGSWNAAVARAQELGATELAHHQQHGTEWIVFADPEGNEFCV